MNRHPFCQGRAHLWRSTECFACLSSSTRSLLSRSHQRFKAGALSWDALWFLPLQEESSGCGQCTDTTPPSRQHFLLVCWGAGSKKGYWVWTQVLMCLSSTGHEAPGLLMVWKVLDHSPISSFFLLVHFEIVRFPRLVTNLLCSPGKP